MSNTKINNWNPVVQDLLDILETAGFEVVEVDNGGEDEFVPMTSISEALDEICATDESWLRVSNDSQDWMLFIVLGNEPVEIVADYSVRNGPAQDAFEKALETFGEKWEDRRCPTKTR